MTDGSSTNADVDTNAWSWLLSFCVDDDGQWIVDVLAAPTKLFVSSPVKMPLNEVGPRSLTIFMSLSPPPPVDGDDVDNWTSFFVTMKSNKYRGGLSTAFDGKTRGISSIVVVPTSSGSAGPSILSRKKLFLFSLFSFGVVVKIVWLSDYSRITFDRLAKVEPGIIGTHKNLQ